MSLAIAKLESRIARMTREELLALAPEEAAAIDFTLRDARWAESVASFDAGPLYWLTRHTMTENPQYEAQGVPFKAPFPRKGYFVPLFNAFLANRPPLFIPKSRTMMTSWAAMGFSTARAQWHREETVVQTANEDKAAHLIDYARQLWDNQDDFLKQRHPVVRRSTYGEQKAKHSKESLRSHGRIMSLNCSSGVALKPSLFPALPPYSERVRSTSQTLDERQGAETPLGAPSE